MYLRNSVLALSLLTTASLTALAAPPAAAQQNQSRSVTGIVLGANGTPIKEAVVYLKNEKTLAIKSYISESDGVFRFLQLSPNVDYQLWAEWNGTKSTVKTISSFDSRPKFTVNLHIEK